MCTGKRQGQAGRKKRISIYLVPNRGREYSAVMGDTVDLPDVREFLSACMQGRDTGADGCSRKERANKNSFIHMAGTASSKAVFFYTGRYLCRSEYSFIRKRKWHPETGCQEEGADQNWV